jgi:hypothetical protein
MLSCDVIDPGKQAVTISRIKFLYKPGEGKRGW